MRYTCACGEKFSRRKDHDAHWAAIHPNENRLRMKPENRVRCTGQLGMRRPNTNARRSKSPLHWLDGSLKYKKSRDGCWLWQAHTNQTGYGMTDWKGKVLSAHRVAYEQFKGKIPEGLVLDHLCRNPRCVNPAHLEPVTYAENNRRGVRAKLKHATVIQIKKDWKTGAFRYQAQLARKYGVRNLVVHRIIHGISWAGVGD